MRPSHEKQQGSFHDEHEMGTSHSLRNGRTSSRTASRKRTSESVRQRRSSKGSGWVSAMTRPVAEQNASPRKRSGRKRARRPGPPSAREDGTRRRREKRRRSARQILRPGKRGAARRFTNTNRYGPRPEVSCGREAHMRHGLSEYRFAATAAMLFASASFARSFRSDRWAASNPVFLTRTFRGRSTPPSGVRTFGSRPERRITS